MDKRKYWTACRLHDWHWFMSDDPAHRDEQQDVAELLGEARKTSPELERIYNEWHEFHFNCGPKPTEPRLEI